MQQFSRPCYLSEPYISEEPECEKLSTLYNNSYMSFQSIITTVNWYYRFQQKNPFISMMTLCIKTVVKMEDKCPLNLDKLIYEINCS